ncbi:MAG: hypothetical protein U0790_21315 [Isosphaeraceae bacterium]
MVAIAAFGTTSGIGSPSFRSGRPPCASRLLDIRRWRRTSPDGRHAAWAAPSAEDIDLLSSYDWPGNIRELAAVIERAAILGNGDRLDVARAMGMRHGRVPTAVHRSLVPPPVLQGGTIAPLDTAIARHIEAALMRTRGRIEGPQGAAALLRINPHTLRARMRKLGLDWRSFRDAM